MFSAGGTYLINERREEQYLLDEQGEEGNPAKQERVGETAYNHRYPSQEEENEHSNYELFQTRIKLGNVFAEHVSIPRDDPPAQMNQLPQSKYFQ